jgi:hypothetical protein
LNNDNIYNFYLLNNNDNIYNFYLLNDFSNYNTNDVTNNNDGLFYFDVNNYDNNDLSKNIYKNTDLNSHLINNKSDKYKNINRYGSDENDIRYNCYIYNYPDLYNEFDNFEIENDPRYYYYNNDTDLFGKINVNDTHYNDYIHNIYLNTYAYTDLNDIFSIFGGDNIVNDTNSNYYFNIDTDLNDKFIDINNENDGMVRVFILYHSYAHPYSTINVSTFCPLLNICHDIIYLFTALMEQPECYKLYIYEYIYIPHLQFSLLSEKKYLLLIFS